jgi:hypothetical protein
MTECTAEQAADHRGESGGIDVRLRFRILGPVQVLDHGGDEIDVGGSKPRLVLVQLLLNPNRMVSSDALIDVLWGDDPPPSARWSSTRTRSTCGGVRTSSARHAPRSCRTPARPITSPGKLEACGRASRWRTLPPMIHSSRSVADSPGSGSI